MCHFSGKPDYYYSINWVFLAVWTVTLKLSSYKSPPVAKLSLDIHVHSSGSWSDSTWLTTISQLKHKRNQLVFPLWHRSSATRHLCTHVGSQSKKAENTVFVSRCVYSPCLLSFSSSARGLQGLCGPASETPGGRRPGQRWVEVRWQEVTVVDWQLIGGLTPPSPPRNTLLLRREQCERMAELVWPLRGSALHPAAHQLRLQLWNCRWELC